MSGTCRRRPIVETLERNRTPMTVDQLVDTIAGDDASVEDWGDVHEELTVVDLPVLDATGDLEYEPRTGLVDLPAEDPEPTQADQPSERVPV